MENIVKWSLLDDASPKTVPGMTFADVTIAKKKRKVNYKSIAHKNTVPRRLIKVSSLEEFPPLSSVPAKVESVPTKEVVLGGALSSEKRIIYFS